MGRELSDLIDKGKEEMRDIRLRPEEPPRPSSHANTADYVNDFPTSFLPSWLVSGKSAVDRCREMHILVRKVGGHSISAEAKSQFGASHLLAR